MTTTLDRRQRVATGGASRPRTAFVLSGGASLGALQVGMLEALYERGITPDFLVGTSVGALNAAFVASRLQSPETATELGRRWRDPSPSRLTPRIDRSPFRVESERAEADPSSHTPTGETA